MQDERSDGRDTQDDEEDGANLSAEKYMATCTSDEAQKCDAS